MCSACSIWATMYAALFHLRRIPGIDRPAIGAIMPTLTGDLLLIDAGANTEVHPEYLVQFAQMGGIYMEQVRGVARPRIGLLSSGEEETKGTKIVQETHQLLKTTA